MVADGIVLDLGSYCIAMFVFVVVVAVIAC